MYTHSRAEAQGKMGGGAGAGGGEIVEEEGYIGGGIYKTAEGRRGNKWKEEQEKRTWFTP